MMLVKVRQPLPEYFEACYATECSCSTRCCSVDQVSTLLAGFGHFAVAVPDVYKAVDDIKAAGEAVLQRLRPHTERTQRRATLARQPELYTCCARLHGPSAIWPMQNCRRHSDARRRAGEGWQH